MIELLVCGMALLAALVATMVAFWLFTTQRTPPGPNGIPFLGYLPFLRPNAWKAFSELGKRYGNVFSLYMGPQFTIVLQDLDAIQEALVEKGQIFLGRSTAHIARCISTGKDGQIHGILQVDPPQLQPIQQFIANTFDELGVNRAPMDHLILEEVEYLIDKISEEEGSAFDPADRLHPAMVNILLKVIVNRRLPYDGPEYKNLTLYWLELNRGIGGSLLNFYPWLRHIPGPLKAKWHTAQYSIQKGYEFLNEEISKHEKSYQGGVIKDFFDAWIRHVRGALKHNSAFAEKDDLITTSFLMVDSGAEKSTVGLTWALLFLCKNRRVQAKVHEELDQVIGGERPITYQDKEILPYTLATYYEFLRLGGLAPVSGGRKTMSETELMGFKISKGTTVLSNSWAVRRDPKYVIEPLSFMPERYIDADGKTMKPHFMPWMIGPRACPGRDLSENIMFIVFANLLNRFEFRGQDGLKLPPDDEYDDGASPRPRPFQVQVRKRC